MPTNLSAQTDQSIGEPQSSELLGPAVKGMTNSIELKWRENALYVGNLYMGKDNILTKVVFDTRTRWTGVLLEGIDADMPSDYDVLASETSVPYTQGSDIVRGQVKSDFDTLSGAVYHEHMCLSQEFGEGYGSMCLDHQIFLAVDQVSGPFDVQGFVGLGPQWGSDNKPIGYEDDEADGLSYPVALYDQQMIEKLQVGINFENPAHKHRVSTITFGYFDMSNIKDGEDGLIPYKNEGKDNWSLDLYDIMYNGKTLEKNAVSKPAHIDTAEPYIALPMEEFKQITADFKKIDRTIHWERTNQGPKLKSNKRCEELYDKFGDLEFKLAESWVTIKPAGYMYPSFDDQEFCYIGIRGIADYYNEYRLGSIFLRNFFVGLDYDEDKIHIGLNSANTDSEMVDLRIHGDWVYDRDNNIPEEHKQAAKDKKRQEEIFGPSPTPDPSTNPSNPSKTNPSNPSRTQPSQATDPSRRPTGNNVNDGRAGTGTPGEKGYIPGDGTNKGDDNKSNDMAIVFVVIFLVVLVIVAVACYVRSKRLERQRQVTFDYDPGSTTDPTKTESGQKARPRYKNGEEILPSEYKQMDKEEKQMKKKKKKASVIQKSKKSSEKGKKSGQSQQKLAALNATRDDDSDEEQLDHDEQEHDQESSEGEYQDDDLEE